MERHALLHPPRRPPRGPSCRGFTLIESGIVLAVIAIVAGLAAPSLRELVEGRRLQGAAATLAVDLRFARAEALARQTPLRFSVKSPAGGSCYLIHTGSAAQCDCADAGGPARCNGDAVAIRSVRFEAADSIVVQANVGSMLIDPTRGTVTPTGTLRVIGRSGRAIHQVVNIVGRVRTCSPNGVPGTPPC